nr:chitin-binding domain protein cbd-1-like isoform X1 [Megalopta genalis]
MRELLILMAIASMAAAINNYTECPDTEPWSLPHEYDCTKYYKCYMGRKFQFDCNKDSKGNYLCFDPEEQLCSLWNDCKCRSSHCVSSSDVHKWADPTNEGWYYQCKNGRSERMQCQQGTVFDPAQLECRTKSDKCTVPGTRYPHECYCDLYYECKNGQLTGRSCPTGWLFDDVLLSCQPAKDAHCDGKRPNDNGCPATGKAQLPDPESCYRFYQCVDGVKTLRPCPYGTAFDEVKLMCIWWSEATCSKNDFTTPKSTSHSCLNWPKSKKANMEDCNKYYECVDGEVQEGKCLEKHYFNEMIQSCDLEKTGNCKEHTPKDQDCPDVDCGKKRYPHNNCEWYYECQNGIKQEKVCPSGLYFNKDTEMCDLRDNVECANCKAGTRTPHECQCNQYYECNNNGEQTLKTCPAGKNFDMIILDCLPQEKATCHKRGHNPTLDWRY